MLKLLFSRLPEVLAAIAPLLGVIVVLQFTIVDAPLAQFVQFLAGSILAILGMALLFAGIDHGILPMGRFIGAELPRKRSLWLIAGVGAAMGFVTTVAEPDVLILATQAEAASGNALTRHSLVLFIAAGVAILSAAGLLRIARGIALSRLLAPALALIIVLSLLAAPQFVPLAYDAGSVTTGVLTAPVLLALAIGVSSVLARRAGALDGFGLLGLASLGPILVLLLSGWLR